MDAEKSLRMEENKPRDLETRLIDFAAEIIDIIELLPNSRVGNQIAGQLVRSGTSPAANYAEARSAESRRDFIHKMRIALKELRETQVWLRIVERKKLGDSVVLKKVNSECDELIAIFVTSIKTAESER